ncbi:hypothetical protein HAX54_012917, partial [Datura stramonium]|nr:hypothetical protein [Datura stramonium]
MTIGYSLVESRKTPMKCRLSKWLWRPTCLDTCLRHRPPRDRHWRLANKSSVESSRRFYGSLPAGSSEFHWVLRLLCDDPSSCFSSNLW